MNTQEVIRIASQYLDALSGHTFDVLDISKGIEEFKQRVYNIEVSGMKVSQWNRLLSSRNEDNIRKYFQDYLEITEETIDEILD